MDSLEEQNSCIVLNNQSAECIVNGEYDKGINALLKVLALMRNSIARQNQSPTEAHSYGRCNDYTSARVPEFWYGSQCSSVASFPSSSENEMTFRIDVGCWGTPLLPLLLFSLEKKKTKKGLFLLFLSAGLLR